MNLKATLREAMKDAMKARAQIKLDAIRSVLSAIQYEEMQKNSESLPEGDLLGVLKREIKKRQEELEFAEKANRADIKEKINTEISALEVFLPKQLSEEELRSIISELKSANPSLNMGMAMKALKESYAGQYDSKLASELAKTMLG